jgi:outer membrane lipoprotein-sorting protein
VKALFMLAAAFASASAAQEAPPAREILEKVRDAYSGVQRFRLVMEIENTEAGGAPKKARASIAAQYPDKLRMEGSLSQLVGMRMLDDLLVVCDGADMWLYDARRNQYLRRKGGLPKDDDISGDELKSMGIQPGLAPVMQFGEILLSNFRSLARHADEATLLRTEDLMVNGQPVRCHVVEVKGNRPGTNWIDARRFLVWRQNSAGGRGRTSTLFTTISLNEPLPAYTFQFTLPAGAGPLLRSLFTARFTASASEVPWISQRFDGLRLSPSFPTTSSLNRLCSRAETP